MSVLAGDEWLSEGKNDNAGAGFTYTRRKSVAVIAATKQNISRDKIGDKQKDEKTSVTSFPTFCGPFEVKLLDLKQEYIQIVRVCVRKSNLLHTP